ncbi:MAG: hypothetical protein GY716_23240 [bacterium]|nr:hypothetical protein [bacterium]
MALRRVPWITLAIVSLGVAAATISGANELLQYDRGSVDRGVYLLLLSGQFVHWTSRMALADLLIVLLAGTWVELRRRSVVAWTYLVSFPAVGLAVHLWDPDLALYRGSSGIASSLVTVTCLDIASSRRRPNWVRGVALAALGLLAGKIVWEAMGGAPLAAGDLPFGVVVTPSAHVAGVAAGACCFAAARAGSSNRPDRSLRSLT